MRPHRVKLGNQADLFSSSYNIAQKRYADFFLYGRDARLGEVMHVAAWGDITVYEESGYSSFEYVTLSPMADTTISSVVYQYGLSVYTDAIRMFIPSSLVTGATSVDAITASTWTASTVAIAISTNTLSNKHNYHLFHLGFVLSIVVTIAIGIAGCCGLWCCLAVLPSV
jgi:hypothetical protein